jgi:hypothetical protein
MASKFVFKPFVTTPMAPIMTGIIIHFMFHIRCISIHKLSYFSFVSASFCVIFLSAVVATSTSMYVFVLIIISGLFIWLRIGTGGGLL